MSEPSWLLPLIQVGVVVSFTFTVANVVWIIRIRIARRRRKEVPHE